MEALALMQEETAGEAMPDLGDTPAQEETYANSSTVSSRRATPKSAKRLLWISGTAVVVSAAIAVYERYKRKKDKE